MRSALIRDPVRFLIIVVIVDVAIAAVLRFDKVTDLLSGQQDWLSWLGLLGALYLFVVAYAVWLVSREGAKLRYALRRRERTLAAHAETTNDWLWETTPELVITYCSPQVEVLLGHSPDDLVGRSAHELMVASTARRSREALASGLAGQGWRDVRSEWLHAKGHVVTLRHSGAAIRGDDGQLLGYRGNGAKVTAEEAAAWGLADLRRRVSTVITESRLTIALQPIIDVQSGRLVGAEALSRFTDGGRPDVWFEDAGKVGLRFELETLAIRCALGRLPELPDGIRMSINACPEVITDPRFTKVLQEVGVPLTRVTIEITEHARIEEYSDLQAALSVLRAAGGSVAVDDAGAGFASLSHVLRLRPDNIKLDRSIVADVDADQARRTLITALVLLALDIGATITAEGIETAAELEAVTALGVDLAQGYLIARPSVDISAWPASFLT